MQPTKILICEDEAIVALELQERLKDFGYEVAGIADNGVTAHELAAQHRPDIALMDIRLNGNLSGPEIAESLRKDFGIPSIYLSAYGDPETVELASRTDPLGYLIKPVRDQELDFSIRFGLVQHRAQKALREKAMSSSKKLERAQTILTEMNETVAREMRMRGLQDLIGGIAHYFNNSIMSISGFLEFLRDCGGLQPYQVRQIQRILDVYTEQKTFVKRLLWASGNSSSQMGFHSLQEIVLEAIEKARLETRPTLTLSKVIPEPVQMASVDREAIVQALMNVIDNSIEAMGGSGNLSISLTKSIEEMPERYNSNAVPGKFNVITVHDSGPGIPADLQAKVVEPFYSTRLQRLATGLGLSEAYGILQAHEGWVEITSQPGQGTVVQLFIPYSLPSEQH